MERANATNKHKIRPERKNGHRTKENGAILNGNTYHPYLHLIENKDEEIFDLITKLLIEENRSGKIDLNVLKKIRSMLIYFEKEHCADRNKKGNLLIKDYYISERIKL